MCAGRALPSPVPAPPPINSAPQGARIERPPSAPRRRLLTAPRRGAAPPAPRAAPPRRRAGPRARWAPRHSRGCYLSPKRKRGAHSRFGSCQGHRHTHVIKKPCRAHPGPFWAPGGPPWPPRQWEGVTGRAAAGGGPQLQAAGLDAGGRAQHVPGVRGVTL